MTQEEFERQHGVVPSDPFPPARLYSRPENKTRDPQRLVAVHFDFYRFDRPRGWPAAIVAHTTTQERVQSLEAYACRHRCRFLTFPSWHRADLIAVAIMRRLIQEA